MSPSWIATCRISIKVLVDLYQEVHQLKARYRVPGPTLKRNRQSSLARYAIEHFIASCGSLSDHRVAVWTLEIICVINKKCTAVLPFHA